MIKIEYFLKNLRYLTEIKFREVTVLLLFTILAASSFAQVVDIESQRFSEEGKGFFGKVGLNGNYTQNTQQIWQVTGNSKLLWKWKKNRILFFSDFGLVQTTGNDLINRGFSHVRYNRTLTKNERLTAEVFQQVQYNRVQKINLRALTGAGLRFKVLARDSAEAFFGVSSMYEYEEVQEQFNPNRDARMSSYFSLDWQINKNVTVNNISYFQPLFADFSDFRLTNQTRATFVLSKMISFQLVFSLLEDTKPPTGIPNTIITLENGLTFNF